MRSWFRTVLLATATLALAPAPAVLAQDAPDPHTVRITGYNYNGSGCPQGSVASNLSPDAKAITLTFDQYLVEGVPGTIASKACNVNVALAAPRGWTFALFNVDYRGYAEVTGAAVATQQARYAFAGSAVRALGNYTARAPTAQNYQYRNTIPVETLIWSTCDGTARTLSLMTDVQIDARAGGDGVMTVDSIDGELVHQYGIAWRRCPPTDPHEPFVVGLYMDTLGRIPSQQELDAWIPALRAGRTRQQVARLFLESPEKRTWEVALAFQRYLGRNGSPQEVQAWVNQVVNARVTSDEIQVGFVGSNEFWTRFGSTPQGFVIGCYRTILGREPSAAEVNVWVPQVARGRNEVAKNFVTTSEHRTKLAQGFYSRYLKRPGSAPEWNNWVRHMQGLPRDGQESALSYLLSSDEYLQLQLRRP